ncbi:hypothetical protein AB6C94_00815 [Vibrio splendidus]|mgnify:FL=1|jgi:hypothetical protein|uniref:Uncharacterized protein n=1 Tax=Vibrio splendidus TaxID=29497 RepID=A0AB35N0L3_VIBSP|nr:MULTISPECIES: hypothetical protein [Vibrio]MDE9381761.1 hypothetical protein [Vibrio alginolyticus]MBY7729930.1 hypothetical protein [Vibrio splendidus]MCG9604541.1 hypothetical protein [Vibrio chagasii]MDP2502614.1 hypothetical protein [Vibrio splendidus]ROO69444.1 hypothetical protein EDB57_3113 [Vibrio crassostreae]
MPLIVVLPLLAGGLGFGAGFWSGSSATKLLKVAAVGGGCYVAYRVIKGGK